jgi:hypothetical protein
MGIEEGGVVRTLGLKSAIGDKQLEIGRNHCKG